jgi:hypothetical protein
MLTETISYSASWAPTPLAWPFDIEHLEDLTIPGLIFSIKHGPAAILLADGLFLPNSPKLFSFQNASMEALDDHAFIWMQAIRGAAKSYTAARFVLVKGLTNKIKVVFTAPTFRQAKHLFEYVAALIAENDDPNLPMDLGKEVDSIVRSSERAVIRMKNGTEFIALPMGDGERIRGERADILVIDEFFNMQKSMYQSHILPFLQGHKAADAVRKLILLTSAEYQDSFAYTVLTKRFLAKIVEEDKLIAANPSYKRKYMVLDINIDDVLASGYNYDMDVLEQQLAGATDEERQQALYNRWIGISGQFFPGDLYDRMISHEVQIEHEGDKDYNYCLSVDVAFEQGGDFMVIDVWKMLPERRRMALVNSYWKKGLSSDELASKIHRFNARFNPTWIVMDKGGGGLSVRDSLMKTKLIHRDNSEETVAVPILEHNELRTVNGQRKLIFNRPKDPKVGSCFADDRSRGGEHINAEDILVHLLHGGLRQTLQQDDIPILIPATYTDNGGDDELNSNAMIYDRIKESVLQLRHLAVKVIELSDGTKEVVKTKVNKVPAYVWKNAVKDGASAFIYGYICYKLFYKDRAQAPGRAAVPVSRPTQDVFARFAGIPDIHKPGQLYKLGQ